MTKHYIVKNEDSPYFCWVVDTEEELGETLPFYCHSSEEIIEIPSEDLHEITQKEMSELWEMLAHQGTVDLNEIKKAFIKEKQN